MPSFIMFGLLRLLAVAPALTFHEFAHAYSAYKFGDMTPKMQHRISLNPLDHLDPIGALMIMFGPIGWAKPVMVNPYNFRDPAKHMMLSTACGPLANILQGVVVGLVTRVLILAGLEDHANMHLLLVYLVLLTQINFGLAVFNLVPLGPLDGHEVLHYFLPYDQKVAYHRFNSRYGMVALLVLIFTDGINPLHPLNFVFGYAGKLAMAIIGI